MQFNSLIFLVFLSGEQRFITFCLCDFAAGFY